MSAKEAGLETVLVQYLRIAYKAESRKAELCPDCKGPISTHNRVCEDQALALGCTNTRTRIVRLLDGVAADDRLNEDVSDYVCYHAINTVIKRNKPMFERLMKAAFQ